MKLSKVLLTKKCLDVTVSSSWWKSFCSRHNDLTLRDPETLTHAHVTGASDAMLESYFDLLETTLIEVELMERPCQISNLDQSGFPLSPKPPKVISKKGAKTQCALQVVKKVRSLFYHAVMLVDI